MVLILHQATNLCIVKKTMHNSLIQFIVLQCMQAMVAHAHLRRIS